MRKKGRIALLISLWTAALALFCLSATAANAKRPETPMTAAETSYRAIKETSDVPADETPKTITAEGCLSETDLAELLSGKLGAVLQNVSVSIGEGSFTLYGDLTSDTDALLTAYPALAPYEMILRLIGGAPVSATLDMTWTPEEGFTASAGEVTLAGVPIPVGDLGSFASSLADSMNRRFAGTSTVIEQWKLQPGGFLYRATLPNEDWIPHLYPVPL